MRNFAPMMLTCLLLLAPLPAQAQSSGGWSPVDLAGAIWDAATEKLTDLFVPSEQSIQVFQEAAGAIGDWGPFGMVKNTFQTVTNIPVTTSPEAGLIWRGNGATFGPSPPSGWSSALPTSYNGTGGLTNGGGSPPPPPPPPPPSSYCDTGSAAYTGSPAGSRASTYVQFRSLPVTLRAAAVVSVRIFIVVADTNEASSLYRLTINGVTAHSFNLSYSTVNYNYRYNQTVTVNAPVGAVTFGLESQGAGSPMIYNSLDVQTAACTSGGASMSSASTFATSTSTGSGSTTFTNIPTTFGPPPGTGSGPIICDFRPLNTSSGVGSIAGTVRGWVRFVAGLAVFAATALFIFKTTDASKATGG